MNAVTIRGWRTDDAEALPDLYARSVRALGAREYSPRQVEAWGGLTPSPEALIARMADERARFVAVSAAGDRLGFVDVEHDGHIDLLYVAPEAAGRGIGRGLLVAAERWAKSASCDRLFAEVSETARGLFERSDFVVTARRDFEVAGQPIHNWAMQKAL